jgi:hypothetical protein
MKRVDGGNAEFSVDGRPSLVTVVLMLFHPQTGQRLRHTVNYIPDEPYDDCFEFASEWPDSGGESGSIFGYLQANEPMEHHSFEHHIAVLDQEQVDVADEKYERWLKYILNREKIEKRREAARLRAAKRRELLKVGEFARVADTQHVPAQTVLASRVSTSINKKLRKIKEAYLMFRDGALSDEEYEQLKSEILAS